LKLILLSGGSGKRLWPLSNETRSKQFLKVLENSNGLRESMVQRVWRQVSSASLSDSTVIATSKSQVDIITNQLGSQVPLVIEPERRDTFPAIALAAAYLYSIRGVSLNEVITVLPVDPYVEQGFFEKIKELENVFNNSSFELGLIGVTPTIPTSKYGYIVPKNVKAQHNRYLSVDHFKEKPDESQAKKLIEQGALWNCGVFAFKLDYIISLLIQFGLPIQYEELLNNYDKLPKISFDYEVLEKAKNIVVIPYDGYWKDLGTWNTLTEEMESNIMGKGIQSDDSINSHIVNELDIPISVIGLSNIVVAASPDGILVTEKSASARVKELIKDITQRPMFEEKRWGWYKVLDYKKFSEGREVLTKRLGIMAGKNLSYQLHFKRSEVWTIIDGEGKFVLDDKIYEVKPGDVLNIPQGSKHAIKAETDLEFIEVQTGDELVEEDIERIFMRWEEIEEHCQLMKSAK
jgi:mannose-1-phosphate guanylyltransferase